MNDQCAKVDFFVVGSQRCGTTWIDNALRSTGKISLPINKQTYFFDRNYEQGIEWYEKQFVSLDRNKYDLIGEVATGYCLNGAIDLLAEHYPEAKVILAVREPVSRAYSNYIKRKEEYADMSFVEALSTDKDLVERGLYGEMLERILKYYPVDKVKVVFFDDLERNPMRFYNEISKFLDIDYEVDSRLFTQNVNSSLFESVSKLARKFKFYFLIRFIKTIGLTAQIRKLIYKLRKFKRKPAVLSFPGLYEAFHESNKVLARITKRDLGDWGK